MLSTFVFLSSVKKERIHQNIMLLPGTCSHDFLEVSTHLEHMGCCHTSDGLNGCTWEFCWVCASVGVVQCDKLRHPPRDGILVDVSKVTCLDENEEPIFDMPHTQSPSKIHFQSTDWAKCSILGMVCWKYSRKGSNPDWMKGFHPQSPELSVGNECKDHNKWHRFPSSSVCYLHERYCIHLDL